MPSSLSSSRALRFAQLAIFSIPVTFAAEARADIDLTGRWLVNVGGYAAIVQTGSDVTVTWTEGATNYNLSGTFDQTTLEASGSPSSGLTATQYGGGTYLDGIVGSPPLTVLHRRFTRCECYDGNANDGDGCSAECRVEPCYECTPEPSMCTPSVDTSPCDDDNDCTTGETCSSGTCGGGTPQSPCVNMTGDWQVVSQSRDAERRYESAVHYTQRDGVLFSSARIGTVDAATGALHLDGRHGIGGTISVGCTPSLDGTASLDNLEFEGTNTESPGGQGCGPFPFTHHGRRCDDTAGCGLTDCTGYADDTPCDDGKFCTVGDKCFEGVCGGGPRCFACLACDESDGSCDEAPRTDCLGTQKSNSSRFQYSLNKYKLAWSWRNGDTFDAEALDPAGPNDLTLCLFANGERLYQLDLPSDAPCEKPPCWKGGDGSYKYRNDDEATAIVSMVIKEGDAGKSKFQLKAKGGLLAYYPDFPYVLPEPPLTLPLVTQLQSSAGACFEADFDATGTTLNSDGEFKATGGTQP